MAKKAVTVRKIERCGRCPYNGAGWCNHPDGWEIIPDFISIPDWCPLPEWSKK